MPYCPRCLRERTDALARCPLDRSFYVEARCPACGFESLPRDLHCGACGARLGPRQAEPSALQPATPVQRLLALAVDGLALFSLIPVALDVWDSPAAAVLTVVLYFVGLESGGRQTLGQFVLRCIVLDEHWRSLSPRQALRRLIPFRTGSRLWRSPEL